MGKVIILVGPPGVGKDYWIKKYTQKISTPYVVCSADDYFMDSGKYNYRPQEIGQAHSTCFEKFSNALRSEVPLIFVSNTNIVKDHRSKYVNKALQYDYDVEIKVFPVNIEVIKRQNSSPERLAQNKIIPDSVIDRMVAKLDIEPGLWRAEHDGGRSYKTTRMLESNDFVRKDINKVDDKSVVTKGFAKASDIKTDKFKRHCNELMLSAMQLKEKISLLQAGITDSDKLEPLDDAYAASELVVHHMEDLIQDS